MEKEILKPKKIPELYAFSNELTYDMEQEFIDEVSRQVKNVQEELYAAIQLFSTSGSEHAWVYRFQQVEKLDPSLVKFEIAHYYTHNSPLIQNYIENPNYMKYSYFDFMVWFYFIKGIVFDYNNKLFMKITKEYDQKKYYFGDKITVDEYYDAMLNKYGTDWPNNVKDYINELRIEEKQRERLGKISGFVRNPFIREYAVPITSDIVVIETPILTDCSRGSYPFEENKKKIKIYHGHKYERFDRNKL